VKDNKAPILVIEDEEETRTSIAHFLRSAGFTVIEASDGKQGMARLRQTDVKLIITDILMPEMDGLEVVIELKKWYPSKRVIAMSKGPELLSLARALGAHATVAKPFEAKDLLNTISQIENEEKSQGFSGCCRSGEETPADAASSPAGLAPRTQWVGQTRFHLAPAL